MAEKTSNYYDSLPYGRLGIIALDSCREMGLSLIHI